MRWRGRQKERRTDITYMYETDRYRPTQAKGLDRPSKSADTMQRDGWHGTRCVGHDGTPTGDTGRYGGNKAQDSTCLFSKC